MVATLVAPADAAPGSLLWVDTPPTVAVDVGSHWTGLCARFGQRALDGACVGLYPGRKLTKVERDALDLDDHVLWRRYQRRVWDCVEQMWDRHFADEPLVRVVFEEYTIPEPPEDAPEWLRRKRRTVPLVDIVPIREVNAGLVALFDAVGVARDSFGKRHQPARGGTGDPALYYDPQLVRKRPDGWMANDHPQNVRDHERAAFDAAAQAHLDLAGVG